MKPDLKNHDALELELKNFSNSIIGKENRLLMENLEGTLYQ